MREATESTASHLAKMHRYYLNVRSVVSGEGAEDATRFPISYVTNICT